MKEQMISYAHKDDPLGVRYRAFSDAAIPKWATDVQVEVVNDNWLGLPEHDSDKLIPNEHSVDRMLVFRTAYDKMVMAGFGDDLNVVLNTIAHLNS